METSLINTRFFQKNQSNVNSSDSVNILETAMLNTDNINALKTQLITTKKFTLPNSTLDTQYKTHLSQTSGFLVETKKKSKSKSLAINNTLVELTSYLDNKERTIYLKSQINKGSYNTIFKFSRKKSHNVDSKIVIRISSKESSEEIKKSELKGIKIQYKLSSKSNFIGTVIDYGKLPDTEQEYSIIERYGLSLRKILENSPKYANLGIVIKFMKNLLQAINTVHDNGYAHLDLKPGNILLKDRFALLDNRLDNLEFALVDFGAAQIFRTDKSKIIPEQMASAAFSPPELLKRKYGKKSDIWAYGVICYLVCVRKFFFKAKAQEIFLGEKKKKISKNINKALNNLWIHLIPKYLKSPLEEEEYLKPLKRENLYILEDFLREVFNTDANQRPNSQQLLQHELFTYI